MTSAAIAIAALAGLLALLMIGARLAGIRPAGSETGQGGPRDLLVPGILVGIVLASLAYDALVGEAKPPPCPRDDPAVTTVFVEEGGALHEHGLRHLPDGRTVDCTLTPPPSSGR